MDLTLKNKLLKNSAAIGTASFIILMCIVLYFGMNKTIEIANVAQDSVDMEGADKSDITENLNKLTFSDEQSDSEYLCIPLKEKLSADDITIENHYMDSELIILIDGVKEDFYRQNALSGSRKSITDGIFEETDDGVMLRFSMDGVYEYHTVLENNNLYISFLNPRELYDKIVVIDPKCGGADSGSTADNLYEKDIALDITKRLKEMLDNTDIKAYYTRMDDVNPSEENRVRLANETRADMYVVISVGEYDDASIYGVSALYNDEYFIPGFGSIELADVMLSSVTTDVRGKALGLIKAPVREYTLRHATVPAAAINVGCISNKQEAVLLGREDYREKIAAGIYDGIMAAYERIN